MHDIEEFKDDLLLNIENQEIKEKLSYSVFDFSDSNNFSRKSWNTYSRTLCIYCKEEDYEMLNENSEYILQVSEKVHHIKDNYEIVAISLVKKNLDGVFSEKKDLILIEEKISFNKTLDCIGEGGFSRVYKYHCDILKTDFAYKILDPSSFNKTPYEINVTRFISEAKTLLTFNHENIVKVYNIGKVIPNSYYIKMEWIDGKDLKKYISDNGPIGNEEFLELSKQIVSAIAYSHSKNILHRDLAERNVLVTSDGIVKILDFGLSKDFVNGPDLTTASNFINTDNVAPEIKDKLVDHSFQSDIYSIGCIMFRILTNKTLSVNFEKELIDMNVAKNIINVIKKATATDLSIRYLNCNELYSDLENREGGLVQQNRTERIEVNSYNLDGFRNLITNGISEITMASDYVDTHEIYRKFIEEDIDKVINSNKFVTNISVYEIFKHFGYKNISYYNKYKINILELIELKTFYNSLPNEDKVNFVDNVSQIISKKTKRYEDPFDNMPF